jgi:hypothetical protein
MMQGGKAMGGQKDQSYWGQQAFFVDEFDDRLVIPKRECQYRPKHQSTTILHYLPGLSTFGPKTFDIWTRRGWNGPYLGSNYKNQNLPKRSSCRRATCRLSHGDKLDSQHTKHDRFLTSFNMQQSISFQMAIEVGSSIHVLWASQFLRPE